MEIRLTRHEPTGTVAVAVARDGDALPHDVRLVDADVADAVAAAIEDLVVSGGLDDVAGDLDAVLALARDGARPATS